MEFIPVKCPSCGGELMLPKTKDEAICNYCGSRFFLRDSLAKQSGPSIETLLRLAGNAMRGGNYMEAYDYFTRIIELEPQSAEAWIGKGAAAGWMSNLANPRIQEMISALSEGLELIPLDNEARHNYELRVSNIIYEVVNSYYAVALGRLQKFPDIGDALDEFWYSVNQHMLNAIDVAIFLNPKNVAVMELGIEAVKTYFERVNSGQSFQSPDGSYFNYQVSESTNEKLLQKINEYVSSLQKVQPNYQQPNIKRRR